MIVLRDKHLIDQGTVMAEGHHAAAEIKAALDDDYPGYEVEHVSHRWVTEEFGTGMYVDVSQHTRGAMPVTVGRLTRRAND